MEKSNKPIFKDGKTNVAGYFNQNKFPVHFTISVAGGTPIYLDEGKFVEDRDKRVRINDPVLETWVGQGMLSREILPHEVDIVFFQRSVQGPSVGSSSSPVSGSSTLSTGQKFNSAPPVNASSVKFMTMDEAKKAGVVPGFRKPEIGKTAVQEGRAEPLPITQRVVDDLPQPVLPQPRPKKDSRLLKFVCPLCHAPFQFRSQLDRHATAKHPNNIAEVLAGFPVDAQTAQIPPVANVPSSASLAAQSANDMPPMAPPGLPQPTV